METEEQEKKRNQEEKGEQEKWDRLHEQQMKEFKEGEEKREREQRQKKKTEQEDKEEAEERYRITFQLLISHYPTAETTDLLAEVSKDRLPGNNLLSSDYVDKLLKTIKDEVIKKWLNKYQYEHYRDRFRERADEEWIETKKYWDDKTAKRKTAEWEMDAVEERYKSFFLVAIGKEPLDETKVLLAELHKDRPSGTKILSRNFVADALNTIKDKDILLLLKEYQKNYYLDRWQIERNSQRLKDATSKKEEQKISETSKEKELESTAKEGSEIEEESTGSESGKSENHDVEEGSTEEEEESNNTENGSEESESESEEDETQKEEKSGSPSSFVGQVSSYAMNLIERVKAFKDESLENLRRLPKEQKAEEELNTPEKEDEIPIEQPPDKKKKEESQTEDPSSPPARIDLLAFVVDLVMENSEEIK